MALPSFTISQTPKLADIIGDIVGSDLVARRLLDAEVLFTCNVDPNELVQYQGSLHRVRPVTAHINTTGAIERDYKPVKLLANDPGLNVEGIQWTIEIRLDGALIKAWTFDAPDAGESINLAAVAPTPATGPIPVTRGPRTRAELITTGPNAGLYQWYDENGVPFGPPGPVTEIISEDVAEAAAAIAATAVTPDIAVAYIESLAPTVIAGTTPGTVRQQLGPALGPEFPAVPGLWEAIANKPVIEFEEARASVATDSLALAAVLSALNTAGGGTVRLPARDIALTATAFGTFTTPNVPFVKFIGTKGVTKFVVTSNHASADRCLFITGSNVSFEGVGFERGADFPLVFILPGANKDGLTFTDCVFNGRHVEFDDHYVHGISLDANGTKKNIRLIRSRFTGLGFPLFQSNATTHTVDTIVVDDCDFVENYADDLCFNAPNSTMKNIWVLHSRFRDNLSVIATHGMALNFAHVTGAFVDGNDFEGYENEAIHIEDYCTDITVTPSNRLRRCGLSLGGYITVMTGSADCSVGGQIDATANENTLFAIVIATAGSGTTPGGRDEIPPSGISVMLGTVIKCGEKYEGIIIDNCPDFNVFSPRISGAGLVDEGVWDEGNNGRGILADGARGLIDAPTIRGFKYGIMGPANQRATLGDMVRGASISDCWVGLLGASPDATQIHGNKYFNCVRPAIVGEGGATAKPCSVVGNSAHGCVYEMEIATPGEPNSGKLVLERAYNYTAPVSASPQSIYVHNNLLKLPVGTQVHFTGGGIFTLTVAVTSIQQDGAFPYELVGVVSVADVPGTAVGMVQNLPHSTTSANNHVLVDANIDTVAEIYE